MADARKMLNARCVIANFARRLAALLLSALLTSHAAENSPPLLTNAQQVLDLGFEAARLSPHPARIHGVVTYPIEDSLRAFVQDQTAGVLMAYTNSDVTLLSGQEVEVEGIIGAGWLAPNLIDGHLRVLGNAPIPEPRPISAARLAAGGFFGQWVSVEGVVRDVAWNGNRRILFVSSGGLRFHTIQRPCEDGALPTNWIDARVELRGVCWTDVDRENKPMGFTLYMPGTNHIRFLREGLDPFSRSALPATDAAVHRQSDDRVKMAGTVLFHAPNGIVFLRTETGAVEARLLVPLARVGPKGHYLDRPPLLPLTPGAQIEVIGAPTETTFAPVLHDAEVRVQKTAAAPRPVLASATELINGQHDRDLVSIKARVIARGERNTLLLQSGDTVFETTVADASNAVPALAENSLVEAVGICLVQPRELAALRSLRLFLRDPSELRVVGHWSPWRSPEAVRVATIAAALGFAALGWIWLLRRRVAQRTAELAVSNQSLQSEVEVRKRAEAELARALEVEKELSQLRSRFVSMVSHEFRTPLGIIMSAAEILRKYADRLTPERRVEHLQEISDATKHMSGMMEQVLLLGRVESGRVAFRPTPLDLAALCRKLADEQFSAANGRCPIQFSAGTLNGAAAGDEGLLRQIFTNLLSNAVKYSPAGSAVEFSLEQSKQDAVFTVRDHGIGIPAAEATRLFTAFHRCANVGEIPGTGLGLLIVKRCVELHGGQITFESREGNGTTFTVRLPLFANAGEKRA
jgi:signal transduction histidine kinase